MPSRLIEGNRAQWHSPARRMLCLKWALCAALLSELALCPKLWVTARSFPTVPVVPSLPDLPQPLCLGLTAMLVFSLIFVAIHPAPGRSALIPPAIGIVLVVFDINRLQPWFYQYSAMFFALALMEWDAPEAKRSRAAWGACACILIGIYFWSGIQKLNLIFAHDIFPFLLQPFGAGVVERSRPLWFFAPVFETSVALLLLNQRTRSWGIGAAVAMHGFLLLALGPLGQNYNSTVWPWSVWMTVMALILFVRNRESVLRAAWNAWPGSGIAILFGVMPALNYLGVWDGFLSASFYSGRLRDGWIYLTPRGLAHLPAVYPRNPKYLVEDPPGVFRLDITQWAATELNIPPYAEPRVYAGIVERLERDGVPPEDIKLVVRDQASVMSRVRTYSVVQIP